MYQKFVKDGDLEQGLIFEFVRYFASLQGFEKTIATIQALLSSGSSSCYHVITALMSPFRNIKLVLDEEFSKHFVSSVKDMIV